MKLFSNLMEQVQQSNVIHEITTVDRLKPF